jgi:hypothetical protein
VVALGEGVDPGSETDALDDALHLKFPSQASR